MEQQQQQIEESQSVQRTIGVSFNSSMDDTLIIEAS